MTNLKQFGFLINMYANDNNGNVSPVWGAPGETAYIAGAAGLFFDRGYVKDPKVYLCPDSPLAKKYDMITIDNADGGVDNSCRVSYEYYYWNTLNLARCRSSEAAIMWDLWGGWSWSSDWAWLGNMSWLKSHRDRGGGVVYVDGHALFLTREDWWVNVPENTPKFSTDFDWPIYWKDSVYGK